jgi:hypothetical protein
MASRRTGSIVWLASLAFLGCSGGQSPARDSSVDLGVDRRADDGGLPYAAASDSASMGLKVNGATLVARDRLIGSEPSYVHGFVTVERDGVLVADAVVVLNGVTLPLMIGTDGQPSSGFYDPAPVMVPRTMAGGTLTLTVTQAGETTTLAMPCPAEVTITSPTDNTLVTSGQALVVTWSGSLDTGIFPSGSTLPLSTDYDVILPYLLFRDYDPATQKVGFSQGAQLILRDLSLSSAAITVPARPGLEIELHIHGKGVTSADSKTVGTCSLLRRVILQVKAG